jgi:hypothetical protein
MSSDEQLCEKMRALGTLLNLKAHKVGGKTMYTAAVSSSSSPSPSHSYSFARVQRLGLTRRRISKDTRRGATITSSTSRGASLSACMRVPECGVLECETVRGNEYTSAGGREREREKERVPTHLHVHRLFPPEALDKQAPNSHLYRHLRPGTASALIDSPRVTYFPSLMSVVCYHPYRPHEFS